MHLHSFTRLCDCLPFSLPHLNLHSIFSSSFSSLSLSLSLSGLGLLSLVLCESNSHTAVTNHTHTFIHISTSTHSNVYKQLESAKRRERDYKCSINLPSVMKAVTQWFLNLPGVCFRCESARKKCVHCDFSPALFGRLICPPHTGTRESSKSIFFFLPLSDPSEVFFSVSSSEAYCKVTNKEPSGEGSGNQVRKKHFFVCVPPLLSPSLCLSESLYGFT